MSLKEREKYLNEGVNYPFSFRNKSQSFEGLTITYHALKDGEVNPTQIGSATGQAENTLTTETLSVSNLAPGEYTFEVWADLGGPSQTLIFPDEDEVYKIILGNRFKINN